MPQFVYLVVPRDGGWVYRLENTSSRVFPTPEQAIRAAKETAIAMHEPGDDTQVRVFGPDRQWHTEWSYPDRRAG
jgi:hypothetical protein